MINSQLGDAIAEKLRLNWPLKGSVEAEGETAERAAGDLQLLRREMDAGPGRAAAGTWNGSWTEYHGTSAH